MPRHLKRITVSNTFWDLTQAKFPELGRGPGYTNLFWYLLFGQWHDKRTHQLLLPTKLLCAFEGKSPKNNNGGEFLQRFKHEALPTDASFEWSAWNAKSDICRRVLSFHLGQFDEVLQLEYAQVWHALGRVYLDGTAFSNTRNKALQDEREREVALQPAHCDEAIAIQQYMNTLPRRYFSLLINRNYSVAQSTASNLPNPNVVAQQRRILQAISSDPKPLYEPTQNGNTVRLFGCESIPNLQRDVRKALTSGCLDADLKNSQLAICAKLWGLEEVLDVLREQRSFWSYLLTEMGVRLEDHSQIKPVIKKALYSICFGMGIGNVKGMAALYLLRQGYDKQLATKFVEHSLVQKILSKREVAYASLVKDGGATTCFGKWVSITECRGPSKVMAEIAQAWELKLIYPAFEVAQSTADFMITVFQHDGFSVYFRANQKYWKEEISRQVQEGVDREGFLTGIEWT